jgi:hypothetical protein
MTYDKYCHYIGKEQTDFIMNNNSEKLLQMKRALIYEFNHVKLPIEIFMKYTIELQLIEQTIKINNI